MGKESKQNAKKIAANRPLNARISYLFNAANYLSEVQQKNEVKFNDAPAEDDVPNAVNDVDTSSALKNITDTASSDAHANSKTIPALHDPHISTVPTTTFSGTTHHLVSQLRAVSLKSQIRLSHDVKRTTCKRCDALLTSGMTCGLTTENKSRGGRKVWADVEVVECKGCGAVKRFPVGAVRQKRKRERGGVENARRQRKGKGERDAIHEKNSTTDMIDAIEPGNA